MLSIGAFSLSGIDFVSQLMMFMAISKVFNFIVFREQFAAPMSKVGTGDMQFHCFEGICPP